MSQTLKFKLDRIQFEAFRKVLSAKGLTVSGDKGKIQKFGADVDFDYVEPALVLWVNSAPMFHNFTNFCNEITAAVAAL